jgi:hypothetical protein
MFLLPAKAPAEVSDYALSFAAFADTASISSYTLAVAAQPNGSASILSQSLTGNVLTAQFGGGVAGVDTRFDLTVTFSDGRVIINTLELPIVEYGAVEVPQTSTKRQLVDMAYEECALAGYEFDVSPEELQSALRRLDALMAEWKVQGIDIGYNAPAAFGQGQLSDWSGIPDWAANTAAMWLALRIAPRMNKGMGAEARQARAAGMVALRAKTQVVPAMALRPWTPYGAANKYWNLWYPFTRSSEV